MKTNKKLRASVKRLADDIARSLAKYPSGGGSSALNYGLDATEGQMKELRALLPDVQLGTHGFMGYVHFNRASPKADRP